MLFLSAITLYSYHYVHKLIQSEANEHMSRIAQLSQTRLKDMRASLLGYTEIVRSDLRLQEYMFIVTSIGSDKQPLQEMYERNFGWLPSDRYMIISRQGQTLVGKHDEKFIARIQHLIKQQTTTTTYIETDDGLELVAVSPITYRDSLLGVVAVTRQLGRKWLENHHQDTGVMAFFEKKGIVLSSSANELQNTKFTEDQTRLETETDTYHTYRLELPGVGPDSPQLWFAIQNSKITARLDQHRRTILILVSIGIIAITLFGMLLIRNFSRPLSQLMNMTREIAAGKLQKLEKTNEQNEVAALANQFSDMVQALIEKQEEVEQIHAALEKSAITDMLTGLHNRRYLQAIFPKLIAQAQRDHNHVAAILIDLDKFKQINDTYGHIAGDQCLAHFADELRQQSRANDYTFRIGGEEFLILTIADNAEGTCNFADKLRQAIANSPTTVNGARINLTISCGISFTTAANTDESVLTHLLHRADKALYRAKQNGRDQVQIDAESVPPKSDRSGHLHSIP